VAVRPLLQKIAEDIDYDDDIFFLVSAILKKRKQTSQVLLDMLPYFPAVN
jgi:hypothetical protein